MATPVDADQQCPAAVPRQPAASTRGRHRRQNSKVGSMDNRHTAVDTTGSASHGGHSTGRIVADRDKADTEPRTRTGRRGMVHTTAPLLRDFLEPANPLMQLIKRLFSSGRSPINRTHRRSKRIAVDERKVP